MRFVAVEKQNLMENYEPELRGLKVLFGLYTFFWLGSIIMPQYFGINIGYDITCARLSNLLFIIYMVSSPLIVTHFAKTVFQCEVFYPLCLYLVVAAYTMVFRADINAFFLVFLEVFSLLMMVYGIRYVIGYRRAIKWIIGCAYFLGFYGLVEFVYGKSLFLQFFATMDTGVVNSYRSGHYRIMGPCGHSLAYGLVILLFIAIACVDLERNEIYLFKRPVLLVVLYVNAFLTGSRSTLGIATVEMVVILLFSKRRNIKKTLFYLICAGAALVLFLMAFSKSSLGQYLLGQIASVIDQAFGTNYAIKYGVDTETLNNSEIYREVLPLVFKLDWLNPLVGRGIKGFGGVELGGVFVHSIDNYYVAQYIKYAYPGMISYILFMFVLAVVLIRDIIKSKSAVSKVVFIGCVFYFFNMWWVDALQTLKYLYIFVAIFYAARMERTDSMKKLQIGDKNRCVKKKRCV